MSLIESLARRYREKLTQARAFSGPSPVADSLVAEATKIMDASAYVRPTTDREALIQASFLLHLLLDHVDAEDPRQPPIHALAHQLVRWTADRAGVNESEINTWFGTDRPDGRLLGASPPATFTADQSAKA